MKFIYKLVLTAVAIIAPAVIHAAPISTNPNLSVAGYNFSGFDCSISKGGIAAFPNTCSQINVNTITSPGAGLEISSNFIAAAYSFDDASVGYHVSSASGISSIGLDFNGFFLGLGVASVTESVYDGDKLVGFATVACGSPALGADCVRSTSVALNGTYYNLFVRKDISVSGFAGLASTSTIDQTFTATPEPSSMALIGSGLLGAFGLLRRKAKKGVEVA
jgi:hypothetical protein